MEAFLPFSSTLSGSLHSKLGEITNEHGMEFIHCLSYGNTSSICQCVASVIYIDGMLVSHVYKYRIT